MMKLIFLDYLLLLLDLYDRLELYRWLGLVLKPFLFKKN